MTSVYIYIYMCVCVYTYIYIYIYMGGASVQVWGGASVYLHVCTKSFQNLSK